MLKQNINWSSIGEWIFIFSFCIVYGIIASAQSRLFPAEGSMAIEVRKEVDFRVNRLNEKYACEDEAIEMTSRGSKMIFIWYEDKGTKEYWCGLLNPDTLTRERVMELAPYIEVLNSDKSIRRINRESNKHISRQSDIQQAGNR